MQDARHVSLMSYVHSLQRIEDNDGDDVYEYYSGLSNDVAMYESENLVITPVPMVRGRPAVRRGGRPYRVDYGSPMK